jgi:DNA-binding transcriptional MerR regulator
MRRVSSIRTNGAAALLGVSPSTLRGWEARFGYPRPRRTEGGHRKYELAEIETLRAAFEQTQDIAAAVAIARGDGTRAADHARLRSALAAFRAERADVVLEESLAVRSLERTVETVLLAAVEGLAGAQSPEHCFAWRYATGWLAAATRVAPPASRPEGVLIFDATEPAQSDALHVQALELFLRRAGLRVLSLPTSIEPARLGNALRALAPSAIVLGGTSASLDVLARLIYIARQWAGDAEVLDFRGALPDTGASIVARLPALPAAAASALCEHLCARPGGRRFMRETQAGGPAQARRTGQALASEAGATVAR